MFGHRAWAGALILAAGASLALACGPFFPWQLFDDRTATLKATPHNSFVFEATHLAPAPDDKFAVVELGYQDMSPDDIAAAFKKSERDGLNGAQGARIDAMRATSTDEAAYDAGEGLPPAIRLYTAGAVDFKANDLDAAARRFAAVLGLQAADGRARATWAAFMAGRTAALQGDGARAAAMFVLTRKLAREGRPDPLGLAVASLGEEARLHYDRANARLVREGDAGADAAANPSYEGYALPAEESAAYRRDMLAAAALYAAQAAHDSNSGIQSLRMVAEDVLAGSDRIDSAVAAPLLERLAVDYALSRLGDDPGHDPGDNDAGMGPPEPAPAPYLATLVAAIENHAGPNPAGADRLAALAYRLGRYDLAGRLAQTAHGPLAEWVKAKLALQRGDLAAAAGHYAAAARGFPPAAEDGALDPGNRDLVVGEGGTVALARGDYLDAFDKLFPVARTYWGDVAYLAERVLTVDELKDFVDAKVPAPSKPLAGDEGIALDPPRQLRDLLARRLMRAGRYAAALDYFTDPKIRREAADYAAALHESDTDWLPVNRAQALFTAAKLARIAGMDILGTEASPDFYYFGGDYDTGIGQDKPAGAYVTAGERARAAALPALPNIRFHYRYVAVDQASRAADLLPARSQAFAAVLCRATGWMMQTPGEEARVRGLYRRYVAQGARVAFASHFGRNCPAPDFHAARMMEYRHLYWHGRHFISRNRWWFGGGAFALLLALVGLVALGRSAKPPS